MYFHRTVVAAALCLLIAGAAVSAVTLTEDTQVNLLRAGSTVATHASWDSCLIDARARAKADTRTSGQVTYTCQTERRRVIATYRANPEPQPEPEPEPEPQPEPQPSGDFAELCKRAVKCVGFDSATELSGKTTSGNGGAPSIDTGIKASGAGSLKMVYRSGGAQASGDWRDTFQAMTPGTKFYFAFKQRFDAGVLSAGGSSNGWKQFILFSTGPSCNQTQVVLEKHNGGFPISYSKCGSLPFRVDMSDGDKRFQQGVGLDCRYRSQSGCWKYPANEWLTFYYIVDFKGTATSSVDAYVQRGGKWQQIIDFSPAFGREGSGNFETIILTLYTTGGANGSGTSWYDDLIISRQPIYEVD